MKYHWWSPTPGVQHDETHFWELHPTIYQWNCNKHIQTMNHWGNHFGVISYFFEWHPGQPVDNMKWPFIDFYNGPDAMSGGIEVVPEPLPLDENNDSMLENAEHSAWCRHWWPKHDKNSWLDARNKWPNCGTWKHLQHGWQSSRISVAG